MNLFAKDKDYATFESLLEETRESQPMRICAYCLSPTAAPRGSAGRPYNSDWNRPSARHTVPERLPRILRPHNKPHVPPFFPHRRFLRQPNKAHFEPILRKIEATAADQTIVELAEKARLGL